MTHHVSPQGPHDRSVRWSDEDGKSLTSDKPRRRRPQHVFLNCVGQQTALQSWGSNHLDDDALLARLVNGEPADSLGGIDTLPMTTEGHRAREGVQGGASLDQTGIRPQTHYQKATSNPQMAVKAKVQRGDDDTKGSPREQTHEPNARPEKAEGSLPGVSSKNNGPLWQSRVRGATATPPESVWAQAANSLAAAPDSDRLFSNNVANTPEMANAAEVRASRAASLTRRDTEPLRDVISDMENWWSRTSLLAKQRNLPGQTQH